MCAPNLSLTNIIVDNRVYTVFNMILTGILSGIITGAVILTGIFVAYAMIKRKIVRRISAFVSPLGDGQASELAVMINGIVAGIASSTAQSLKAVFMGEQSGSDRAERRVAADQALSSPMLSMIAGSFPAVGKMIRKNPALAPLVEGVVSRVISGGGGLPGGLPGGNGHNKFKF